VAKTSPCTERNERDRRGLTRRRFLVVVCSSLASASCAGRPERAVEADGLDRFMRMSRVLTAVPELDADLGRDYFAAFVHDGRIRDLADLWDAAGFGFGVSPPASVLDLEARGVYRDPALAATAALVTRSWYSGIFVASDGEQRVITYVDALAWKTLGYRSTGSSTCGGVFGHWAEKPAGA
jgi:D-sorbitol dehydrogenase-like protein